MDVVVLTEVQRARYLRDTVARDVDRVKQWAVLDKARSASLSSAAYTATRAGQVVEQWDDFTTNGWTGGSTVQVSANRLYSNGSSNPGAVYRALSATGTTTVRIVGTYYHLAGSGGAAIGMSTAVPGSGLGGFYGLYMAGVNTVSKSTNGSLAAPSGATPTIVPLRTYVWTITLDANYLSVVLTDTTSGDEWRAQWNRTGGGAVTVTNLVMLNQHSLALSGAYLGPFGQVMAQSTVTPRTGIEGVGRTVAWTRITNPTAAGGKIGIRVALPAAYDASATTPMPAMFVFHNNGGDELLVGDNINHAPLAKAAEAAGFIVVSAASDFTTSWGSRSALDGYTAAYKWVRDNFLIGDVVFYANSMGGIESLLALAERRIPCVAWAATSPTVNMATNYANATFTGSFGPGNGSHGVTATTVALTGGTTVGAIAFSISVATAPFTPGQLVTIDAGTGSEESLLVSSVTGTTPNFVINTATPAEHGHTIGAVVSATYAQATAGRDPALMRGDAFRGVPMLAIAATDDTVVPKTENTDVLETIAGPYAPEMTVVPATGGHSFSAMPNYAPQIVAFYKKYAWSGN